ncbi:MAG TPA: serine hydrolase domain-containing protein [Steroidobacteraceae bacterium]|nr:serine hydrolase domain-containing protein [Steroidobacteraceae bacterium]
MALVENPGLDPARLTDLRAAVQADLRQQRYLGMVLLLARQGRIGLLEAWGHADDNRMQAVHTDSVFSLLDITKTFTSLLALRAVEQGRLELTTKVVELIPEFTGRGREQITLLQLLTHASGMPGVYSPRIGMCLDDLPQVIAAICENVYPAVPPDDKIIYSPMVNHALMGEMLRRCDATGRDYRQLVEQELLAPLGMRDTSVGVRRDLAPRHLVPAFRGNGAIDHPGHSDLGPNGAFQEEHAQMPWVGIVSTAQDLFRFAEMLRRGGELEGRRVLARQTLEWARRCRTGTRPSETYRRLAESRGWPLMPAYLGLGLSLRGEQLGATMFGSFTSPATFGNAGQGSTLFWVDPERDLTFVGLSAGVMNSGDSIERWQRLSDVAAAAAL